MPHASTGDISPLFAACEKHPAAEVRLLAPHSAPRRHAQFHIEWLTGRHGGGRRRRATPQCADLALPVGGAPRGQVRGIQTFAAQQGANRTGLCTRRRGVEDLARVRRREPAAGTGRGHPNIRIQHERRSKRQQDILDHPRTLNYGMIGVSLILAERAHSNFEERGSYGFDMLRHACCTVGPLVQLTVNAFVPDLVSVLIPCYRQARFLEACIVSLQAQTWPHWEAIVIDDGSPDDTQQVLARLAASEPKLRIASQENLGLSAARNAAIALAEGEFFQFLDADDLLEPDKLRWQVQALRSNPDVSLVFGDALYFDDKNHDRRSYTLDLCPDAVNWIASEAMKESPALEKAVARNPFPPCAPLVRSTSLISVGLFDVSLTHCEDWELWIRLVAARYTFAYVPRNDTRALIRAHPASASCDTRKMTAGAVRMWLLTLTYLTDDRPRRHALMGAAMSLIRLSPNDGAKPLQALDSTRLTATERFIIAAQKVFLRPGIGRWLAPLARRLLPWRWSFLLHE